MCIIQVLNKGPMVSTQKIYQQIVNEDEGGPQHVIKTPRNQNQVKNFKKEVDRQFRISHDAFSILISCVSNCSLRIEKGNHRIF